MYKETKHTLSHRLQELCDCAFEQGYGKYSFNSEGKYLPSLSWTIFNKLKKILKQELNEGDKHD